MNKEELDQRIHTYTLTGDKTGTIGFEQNNQRCGHSYWCESYAPFKQEQDEFVDLVNDINEVIKAKVKRLKEIEKEQIPQKEVIEKIEGLASLIYGLGYKPDNKPFIGGRVPDVKVPYEVCGGDDSCKNKVSTSTPPPLPPMPPLPDKVIDHKSPELVSNRRMIRAINEIIDYLKDLRRRVK